MVRNGALALGALRWIEALLVFSRLKIVSRNSAGYAFRFGIGLFALAGVAELVLARVGQAPVTSKGCTRSGADVVCAGPPMVRVREVDGWKIVPDEAAQTLRAQREDVVLFINSYTSDDSSVSELGQELTRASDGGREEPSCVLSKDAVTAGGRPGVAFDCSFRNLPSRRILVQRGPHLFASLHCIGAPPGACDPVLRTLEWVRPEDPSLAAQF
jgi:hypothetical protein